MADQDYTQDKGFMAASPEDQHAYLMEKDSGYAKATPEDQKAFLAHLSGKDSSAAPATPAKAGFFQKQSDVDPNYSPVKEGAQPFIGAAKGAANTLYSSSNLVNKALRYAGGKLGLQDATDKYIPAFPEQKPEELTPNTTGQKIGYGAEQGAEFMIPGGAIGKGAKAIDAGVDAAKMAPLAAKALKLTGRAGLEAAGSGVVTAAQGGDAKEIETNAAVGGLTPLAAAALKPVASALAEKTAPALANRVLRPVPTQLEKAARFGRNPGQAISDEGIVATSHADLTNKITDKTKEVGSQIGDVLKNQGAGRTVDARPLIEKPIDDAIKQVIDGKIEGGQGMIDRLEELRNTYANDRAMVTDANGNRRLSVSGPKNLTMSANDAHALKRTIGDNTRWSQDTTEQAVNDVKRQIYGNLNDEIQKQVPEVSSLQDRYGNLLEAKQAAQREEARHAARNPFSLTDFITAMGVGGAGYAHAGPEGAMMGAGALAAKKAAEAPLTRTLAVQALKKSPNAVSPEFLQFVRNAMLGAKSEATQ